MTRPQLYPSHQHQWTDADLKQVPGKHYPHCNPECDGDTHMLLADEPDTDTRCTHQDAAGQCLDHQGHAGGHQHPQPEQETRTDA